MAPYYRRSSLWDGGWLIVLVVLFVAAVAAYPIALHSSVETRTVQVRDKETATGDRPYRVFAEDGTVYSVEDSVWFANFRASDRYGELERGKTYECKTAGWRIGLLSAYRNLLDCDEVPAA